MSVILCFGEILKNSFTEDERENFKFFHLRGAIDYKELSLPHRAMMAMMMKMLKSKPESIQENEEFFVLEQTKLNGVSYILVTDSEEDDAECWILKDTSPEESSEAIDEFVEDEKELNGIMGVFEELLEDVEIER